MIKGVNSKQGIGLVYGKHEMDAEMANKFAQWLVTYYSFLQLPLWNYQAPWVEFNVIWQELESAPCFKILQDRFMKECA